MTLLLTLSTSSVASLFEDPEKGPDSLLDVPRFAIDHLQLRGLYLDAAMLSGWSIAELDRLRDRADKAGCPCLVLHDAEELALAGGDAGVRQEAVNRIERLSVAANRLGCNSIAIRCAHDTGEDAVEIATATLRGIMTTIERLELNLLLRPSDGFTETPDGLTDLVKRVGGFRIGVMPTFAKRLDAEEEIERLRKLAPYAGAMLFEVANYRGKAGHTGSDLGAGIEILKKVGYASTVAIEYVGGNPLKDLDKAREELQSAIEAE